MTKKKCIEECRDLWKFLSEDPYNKKIHYAKSQNWLLGCPCCEYVERKFRCAAYMDLCKNKCPLKSLWPYGCEINERLDEFPKRKMTQWERWRGPAISTEDRVLAAKEIYEHCVKLLEKMK